MAQKKQTSPKKPAKKSTDRAPMQEAKQPKAMRPVLPPSYHFPTSPKGMLDWSWARERLTNSYNYVIVTVRPDGRPHAMGMHGLWSGYAYYFGTSPETRKAKNIAANPHCALVCENMEELVIVEGTTRMVQASELPEGLSEASKKKYGWPIDPGSDGRVYKLTPRVVFAIPLKKITTAPTKWVFE